MVGMLSINKNIKPKLEIKRDPEDFVVKEITKSFKVLELDSSFNSEELGYPEGDRYAVFGLQKRNWNTAQALSEIARSCGKGKKSIGYAGTKDRQAVSTQLCSITYVEPEKLTSISIPGIKINFAFPSSSCIRLGDLEGNSFDIRAVGYSAGALEKITEAESALDGVFPNYYGPQRFGSRRNNVDIGIALLKGDFKEAAMRFLTDTSNETSPEAREAREKLASEMDFAKALQYFPKHLKYERKMLSYLSSYGPNYRAAFRTMPRQILMMFVHSVESEIFNKSLEIAVKSAGDYKPSLWCKADGYGFPDYSKTSKEKPSGPCFGVMQVIGYETEDISEEEKKALDNYGLSLDSFRSKQMPELRAKGSLRAAFAPYKYFSAEDSGNSIRFKFSLPSGSYATVLLSEFISIGKGEKE